MINKKRTQRLWRHEGLRRPQRCTKRRRIRPDSAVRHRAEYPNHVWVIDFQFDETSDHQRLKMLQCYPVAPCWAPWSPAYWPARWSR